MTGKPVHSMIRVLDEARATEFYRRAFGLEPADRIAFDDFIADDNHGAVVGLAQNLPRAPGPAADGIIYRAVDLAEEPVRRLGLLAHGRPRGEDRQIRIDLHRIGVDDRCAKAFRKPQRH